MHAYNYGESWDSLTYLLTYLPTYLLTYLLTCLLTYLLTCLPCLPTYLLTYLLTDLLTIPTLPTYLPTYYTYLLTYLLTLLYCKSLTWLYQFEWKLHMIVFTTLCPCCLSLSIVRTREHKERNESSKTDSCGTACLS